MICRWSTSPLYCDIEKDGKAEELSLRRIKIYLKLFGRRAWMDAQVHMIA